MLTTRLFMGYLTFPFVLLEFNASIRLYLILFVCLHLIGLITIYVLPLFIRGEPKSQKIEKPLQTTNDIITTTEKQQNNNVVQSMVDTIANETLHQNGSDAKKWALKNNGPIMIVADDDDNTTNNCDIKINDNGKCCDDERNIVDDTISPNTNFTIDTTSNDVNNHNSQPIVHNIGLSETTNRLNNNINKCNENNKNHLSQKIRERIDSETRNIEEFIDKTVTGIVELKDDLMRVSGDELYAMNPDGLRKRINNHNNNNNNSCNGGININGCADAKDVDTFLRKEMNMTQVKVLPAVLSNGHGD